MPFEIAVKTDRKGNPEITDPGPLSSTALKDLGLDRLISETRPPLAGTRVRPGSRWRADIHSAGKTDRIDMDGDAVLRGFDLRDGRRVAIIDVRRDGTLTTSEPVGRSSISLTGDSTSDQRLLLDVDREQIFLLDSLSRSSFDVRLASQKSGKVFVVVHSVLRLVT